MLRHDDSRAAAAPLLRPPLLVLLPQILRYNASQLVCGQRLVSTPNIVEACWPGVAFPVVRGAEEISLSLGEGREREEQKKRAARRRDGGAGVRLRF